MDNSEEYVIYSARQVLFTMILRTYDKCCKAGRNRHELTPSSRFGLLAKFMGFWLAGEIADLTIDEI